MLIQALGELGYDRSAKTLSRESGFEVETLSVSSFRKAVTDGRWEDAELLLFGESGFGGVVGGTDREERIGILKSKHAWTGRGLTLVDGANKNEMVFWMRQQKYLELLELRDGEYG